MIISTNGHKAAVGKAEHAVMAAATPACIAGIRACQNTTATCLPALELCEMSLEIPYTLTGMNPYDMRAKCAVPPLCYDFSNVKKYLQRDDVRAALGVKGRWADCSKSVTIRFELSGDYIKNYQQLLPELLGAGVRILIYAGDQDYICNWLGNQAWTLALPWPGQGAFRAAAVADWPAGAKKAGELRASGLLSFLRVLDAGHMVPMDQPRPSTHDRRLRRTRSATRARPCRGLCSTNVVPAEPVKTRPHAAPDLRRLRLGQTPRRDGGLPERARAARAPPARGRPARRKRAARFGAGRRVAGRLEVRRVERRAVERAAQELDVAGVLRRREQVPRLGARVRRRLGGVEHDQIAGEQPGEEGAVRVRDGQPTQPVRQLLHPDAARAVGVARRAHGRHVGLEQRADGDERGLAERAPRGVEERALAEPRRGGRHASDLRVSRGDAPLAAGVSCGAAPALVLRNGGSKFSPRPAPGLLGPTWLTNPDTVASF